jgi:4-hydroxy-tetrahydrodipicolinate synthase
MMQKLESSEAGLSKAADVQFRDVMAPVLTPFRPDRSCDLELFPRFCRWLEGHGVGLAIFGTNSEANSLTVEERLELLARLIEGGVAPSALVPGTGACAIGDSVRLTSAAMQAGCGGVLMLPPFYYKGVSEDGLFAAFAEVIERVGDGRLRVLLYHIPQVSGVPLPLTLIERLIKRYPQTIAGMKDSSGDFNNTRAAIERFPGFKVYSGSDSLLLQNLRHGGAGCISATANVNPAAILRVSRHWQEESAGDSQAALVRIRSIFERFPMIAALKAAAAHFGEQPSFAIVRPPLTRLTEAQGHALIGKLQASNFVMPGLRDGLL